MINVEAHENSMSAAAIIETLATVTTPVPNRPISRALSTLETMVPLHMTTEI
jgi:hypothetical protein